jgi:Uma2 family endonuclease
MTFIAASALHGEMHGPFDRGHEGSGGWVFLLKPELHLGSRPDIVVPDLAGWRRERLPENFMAADALAFIDLAPDWVCEVPSESTEAHDRGKKRRIYRREGIGHYWLIVPRDKSREVSRLVDGKWLEVDTFEGNSSVRAEPFDAIELDMSSLWAF